MLRHLTTSLPETHNDRGICDMSVKAEATEETVQYKLNTTQTLIVSRVELKNVSIDHIRDHELKNVCRQYEWAVSLSGCLAIMPSLISRKRL